MCVRGARSIVFFLAMGNIVVCTVEQYGEMCVLASTIIENRK